ncbi:MAG: M64 family metallopeptidase [Candidatus Latescibacterota bacterium]
MKSWIPIVTILVLSSAAACTVAAENVEFDDFFVDKTLRIDYQHYGSADTDNVAIDLVYKYGTWAGSLVNLIDTLDYGGYYHKIYDAESSRLIYSRGFDSYFKEYQSSSKAKKGEVRVFHESAIVPCPKKKAVFALEKRLKDGTMVEVFREQVDPNSVGVITDQGPDPEVQVFKSLASGDPHVKADVAIIAEGYTAEEEGKFLKDLERFTGVFFKSEPCKSYKDRFNIYGVFKPSAQSGCDEPRHGQYKKTAVDATFNSMGSERYLLTENNRALRDIARHVPYDALYIMVNHYRYGGGGIYNFYCTFTSDNQWSEYLMVHEFGHSFFGLADEYYTSDTAYNDFYPAGYEPSEPNVTALLDPDNLKWKHLVSEGLEIPTPWEKADYDAQDLAWQEERRKLNDRVARLTRSGAPESEVKAAEEEYDRRDREHTERMHAYLQSSKFAGKTGAFEGAGYASTGLYRPMVDCIMFSKGTPEFCTVCREAMVGVIDWYSR